MTGRSIARARRRPVRHLLMGGLAGLLCFPAAAAGATLTGTSSFSPRRGKMEEYWRFDVRVVAGAGERNDIVSRAIAWDTAEIEDRGAPLLAGPGCEQRGPQRVVCREPVVEHRGRAVIAAELGDGDDAIVLADGGSADGGPGNDTLAVTGRLSANLAGADGEDVLTGGILGDVLVGGDGNDHLAGGDGNDTFDQGAAPDGDDVIDGGAGPLDRVSYSSRSSSVTASLAAGTAGGQGESDRLMAIENVDGGYAADTLIGDEGPNFLHGGCCEAPRPGDRIEGRGGSDLLEGSSGADRISGGSGGDTIYPGRGFDRVDGGPGYDSIHLAFAPDGRHRIACGGGIDGVDMARPSDRVAASCDLVSLGSAELDSANVVVERTLLVPADRRIEVRVAVRDRDQQRTGARIVVTATHRMRSVPVAALPLRLTSSRTWILRASVPARVARLLKRGRGWVLSYRFQTRRPRDTSWSTHGGFTREPDWSRP